MKILVTALTTLCLGVAAAYAAEPAKTKTTEQGAIYTDAAGKTLYTFDKDTKGKSNCDSDCAAKWPPFTAAAGSVAEGHWSLVKRGDGTMMWAHDGKPLYTYRADKKPGDVSGDGVGGVWHLAKAH